jgi:hypothetical protein
LAEITVFWDVAPCSLDVSEVLPACIIRAIALMIEAVSTYETSVNFFQTTRRNIPEDSHLHIRRRENLKSHHRHSSCLTLQSRKERERVRKENMVK